LLSFYLKEPKLREFRRYYHVPVKPKGREVLLSVLLPKVPHAVSRSSVSAGYDHHGDFGIML